jgi:hypothetical protein
LNISGTFQKWLLMTKIFKSAASFNQPSSYLNLQHHPSHKCNFSLQQILCSHLLYSSISFFLISHISFTLSKYLTISKQYEVKYLFYFCCHIRMHTVVMYMYIMVILILI